MIHDLTIGHLDPAGVLDRRTTVLKPLDAEIVNRLLKELEQHARRSRQRRTILGGAKHRCDFGMGL